eukprot:m.298612 g.298612  ORF g.298612 m.298612 type:complete len:142 (-) comp55176_c0_seq4:104-529(-)
MKSTEWMTPCSLYAFVISRIVVRISVKILWQLSDEDQRCLLTIDSTHQEPASITMEFESVADREQWESRLRRITAQWSGVDEESFQKHLPLASAALAETGRVRTSSSSTQLQSGRYPCCPHSLSIRTRVYVCLCLYVHASV